VLKIHSRCNLACDYCYMYEMADQSWRLQPRQMTRPVIGWAAARIGEHAREHRLPRIKLILHGGEPTLADPDLITHAIHAVRIAAGADVRVDVTVQTNGVGLDDSFLEMFAELGARVGVSIDGDAAAHDRHRIRRNGHGSYTAVAASIRRLAAHPRREDLFGGLLCTVDVRNDPVATYEALLEFGPPMIDFLLPHGNWSEPPPFRVPGSANTPYADWLIAVFDRWYAARRRETRIRVLSELMCTVLGGASGTESVGLSPVAATVIETDGSIQQCHALKSAFPGAPRTGLHVRNDSFDAALGHSAVAATQLGVRALCPTCLDCALHRICGAGHYAHRYRAGTGFYNPSVYCPDLFKLISHVRGVLADDVAKLTSDAKDRR